MAIHSSKCADPETCNDSCITLPVKRCPDCGCTNDEYDHTMGCDKAYMCGQRDTATAANLCLASEDDLIYPWRDLYPLAGQTVQHDGEEWCVLRAEWGGHYRKLYRSDAIDGREFIVVVPRTECRPLGWSLMDELTLDLQTLADATGLDVVVVVADLGE